MSEVGQRNAKSVMYWHLRASPAQYVQPLYAQSVIRCQSKHSRSGRILAQLVRGNRLGHLERIATARNVNKQQDKSCYCYYPRGIHFQFAPTVPNSFSPFNKL